VIPEQAAGQNELMCVESEIRRATLLWHNSRVKNRSRNSVARSWQPSPHASGAYRRWLIGDDSLTRRLQSRCSNFAVTHVRQRWARPLPDEATLLELRPQQTALIREVWLQCGETRMVFARSILPRASLFGSWRRLGALGARPLGAVLFGDRKVVRMPLSFRKLADHHPISQRIGQAGLWARRSVFKQSGRAILVTEVFLPGVLDL
jgi:chorismate--pyruvate lyase